MSFPLPPKNRRRACDYQLQKEIGEGALAVVHSALEWDTGRPFALKMFEKSLLSREKKEPDVIMEEHCLRRLNHPGIIKLYASFRDDMFQYFALELCMGGELWFLVKDVGCPRLLARHYLTQLCAAVGYLRDADIVHRDLKAENVLISTDGHVAKLIDFGTAKDLANPHIKGSGTKHFKKVLQDYVGTPNFMAPEVIRNTGSHFKSDIWSLGGTIFQVLSGMPPFFGGSQYRVYKRAVKGNLELVPGLSPEAVDLLGKMVVVEPDDRLGARDFNELQSHPFFGGDSFHGAHRRRRPVLSLEELCLFHIGRRWATLGPRALDLVESRDGHDGLREEARNVVARFAEVKARNAGKGCEDSTSLSSEEDTEERREGARIADR